MIRRKRLVQQYANSPTVELASFAFDGVRLLAHYADDSVQQRFAHGIRVGEDYVTPDGDAQRFFDGLEAYYARSSSVSVIAD